MVAFAVVDLSSHQVKTTSIVSSLLQPRIPLSGPLSLDDSDGFSSIGTIRNSPTNIPVSGTCFNQFVFL